VARAALAPLGVLLAYGLAFAAAALGASPLLFDDHPGQLYRLWHALTRGLAPWTWNPDWWMGVPEFQVYPPGFVYLGAALHVLTLAQLPVAGVYQVLLWIVYLAPGVTAFLLLARLLPDPWLALPGAFVALTLSGETMSGVEGGVRTGMIAARLGWALLPLLVLALVGWIESGGRRPALATLALTAIVLAHPAHAPAAIVLIALAAVVGAGYKSYRFFQAGWLVLTAALLTAFWTLPLLAHLRESRALAWGDPAPQILARMVSSGPVIPVLVLGAVAAIAVKRDRKTVILAAFVPGMLLLIALDRSARLPANRLVDSLVLGLVLIAGLGIGRLLELAGRRVPSSAALGLAATLLIAAISLADPRALTLWPRAGDWPRGAEVERRLNLPALWGALRAAPAGRVLFVRSGVPLVPGTEWYRPHSHVTALTPLRAGRAIVNGTFTHPSPIAGLIYSGSPAHAPITRLVEQLDGERLFGRPLAEIDAETLDRFTDFLGVSTVVMLDVDAGRLPGLETNPRYVRRAVPPYTIYESRQPVTIPEEVARDRWRIELAGVPGSWVPARVTFSPLWRVEVGGDTLPARRGDFGDLEVRLPGSRASVDLVYRDGQWERTGIVVTALGLLVWAARWITPRRRPR
jgi:hypothetical protein